MTLLGHQVRTHIPGMPPAWERSPGMSYFVQIMSGQNSVFGVSRLNKLHIGMEVTSFLEQLARLSVCIL